MSDFKANHFNLVADPWIPVADVGLVSLKDLFKSKYRALGGNPIQKIAIKKLLLAIAQSAYTPSDDSDWLNIGEDGLSNKCLEYLERWQDRFFLFGQMPFLQTPAIELAEISSFGAVQAEVSTGNTTVLTQIQVEKSLTNADKALLIIQLMGFGLGGKKTDNRAVLSPGYSGKTNDKGRPSTGKPGPSIGFLGFLHNFLEGESINQTIWLNIFTKEKIAELVMYPQGMGVAPWEKMPIGEICPAAEGLKNSLMGRLIPMSRFCLLSENGIHYSEGISHPGYKEGVSDPSVSVDYSSKDIKAIWADPNKRPWRSLTALLCFISSQASSKKFNCYQLSFNLERATYLQTLGIWSGGLRVSSNAGEQYISGSDDFVESLVFLPTKSFGDIWFANLEKEMEELDGLSKIVYGATVGYFKDQNMDGKNHASFASNLFWQLCEVKFQDLVKHCDEYDIVLNFRVNFSNFALRAYDFYCPNNSARQLDAWAKNKPNLGKYLNHLKREVI